MNLKELADTISQQRHSNIPAHARPPLSYSDKDAGKFQTAILAYLRLKGLKAWRQSSEGRYLREEYMTNVVGLKIKVGGGKFIPRDKEVKGIGDVCAVLPPNGRFIAIEVKIGKDRQNEEQKEFQREMDEAGAIYFVTKTWDDFQLQISKYIQ